MILHSEITSEELRRQIKCGNILFAGNRKLKIYGTLGCKSGKRMRRDNRVFFVSVDESKSAGYRPCGHCMREEYRKWTCLDSE